MLFKEQRKRSTKTMKNLYIVIFVFICTVIVLSGCTNTKSNNNNNDRMASGPKVIFPKSSKRLLRNNRLTTKSSSVASSSIMKTTTSAAAATPTTKANIETTHHKLRDSKAPKPLVVKLKTKEDFLTFFNGSAVKL